MSSSRCLSPLCRWSLPVMLSDGDVYEPQRPYKTPRQSKSQLHNLHWRFEANKFGTQRCPKHRYLYSKHGAWRTLSLRQTFRQTGRCCRHLILLSLGSCPLRSLVGTGRGRARRFRTLAPCSDPWSGGARGYGRYGWRWRKYSA